MKSIITKKEAGESKIRVQLPFSYLSFPSVAKMHIEANQVQSADTYDCVDDSGKPRHVAENKGYQVKTEYTYQCPVNGADNGYGKGSTV